MAKPRQKSLNQYRLEDLNGVRDIDFGGSTHEKRTSRNYTKSDYPQRPEPDYADRAARRKRYGIDW